MKRFNVVIPKDDGGVEIHPMKEWLRRNSDHIPDNLSPTDSTSHQLRNGLKKRGWTVQNTDTEVRLIFPGTTASQPQIDTVLGELNNNEENEQNENVAQSFGLEYQLRDFLAENIHTISVHGRQIELYVDPTGRDGIEYPTAVGFIDILAVDEVGNFFILELKRGSGGDRVVGQLARYMGWVQSTIGKEKEVNGIVVAKSVDEKLKYAVLAIPNVSLFEYQVEFHLNEADKIASDV